ncbi:MAG: DNA-directed RNA polymerase [Candidatus Hydrothermarchaeales archaeon]
MYNSVVIEDIVRVPPDRFGEPREDVILDILKVGYEFKDGSEGGYEGLIDKDLGAILVVTGVKEIKEGRVISGDGAAYHTVTFEAITFRPELHEIIDGEVVDIVEFGAFLRFGPMDGLVHVSQITDDYIIYDEKRGALLGKESKKALEVGDKVRARIVAVSMNLEKSKESKINLTMRQPSLGKFEWIEEEIMKEKKVGKAEEAKKEKKEEKKGGKPKKGSKKGKKSGEKQ